MKKLILSAALAGMSFSAMAADTATSFTGNHTVTTVAADCPLLSGSVTLGASNNVHAAYRCDDQYMTVEVGACHKGGSREAAVCAKVDLNDPATPLDASDDVWNYSGCTDLLLGKIPDDQDPDFNGYVIGSTGGSIVAMPLGGACTATNLTALDFF